MARNEKYKQVLTKEFQVQSSNFKVHECNLEL